MRNIEANHDAGPAGERIGEILRTALGAPEEALLEDETRRLMLRLSLEPVENEGVARPPDAGRWRGRRCCGGCWDGPAPHREPEARKPLCDRRRFA